MDYNKREEVGRGLQRLEKRARTKNEAIELMPLVVGGMHGRRGGGGGWERKIAWAGRAVCYKGEYCPRFGCGIFGVPISIGVSNDLMVGRRHVLLDAWYLILVGGRGDGDY